MKNAEKKTVKSQKSLQPRVCKAKKSDTFLSVRYVLISTDEESGEAIELFSTNYYYVAFDYCLRVFGYSINDVLNDFKRHLFEGFSDFAKELVDGYFLYCLKED